MGQQSSAQPPPVHSFDGYLSEESKRQFSIAAGVLGGVFFFLQFLASFSGGVSLETS